MRQTAEQAIALYTDTAEAGVAAVAARIAAGAEEEFGTLAFARSGKNETFVAWRAAWRDPALDSWTVESFSRFVQADGALPVRKTTLARGVCFFDALHAVATFEESEKKSGAEPAEFAPGHAHYTQAAQSAAIPLDAATGLPVPAAHGRVLGDGLFSDEALALAKESRGRALLPANDGRHFAALLATAPSAGGLEAAMESAAEMKEIAKVFVAAEVLAGKAGADSSYYYRQGLPMVYTYNMYDLVATLIDWRRPDGSQLGRYRAFEKSLSRMPEGEDRALLLSFSKALQVAVYLETAVKASQDMAPENPKKLSRFGLQLIDGAVKHGGLPEEHAPGLKQRFLERKLPPEGSFFAAVLGVEGTENAGLLGKVKEARRAFEARYGIVAEAAQLPDATQALPVSEVFSRAMGLAHSADRSMQYKWIKVWSGPGQSSPSRGGIERYCILLQEGLRSDFDDQSCSSAPCHTPGRQQISPFRDFEASLASVPDPRDRDLLHAFSKAAQTAIYMECASAASREYSPQDPGKLTEFAFGLIHNATVFGDVPKGKEDELKLAFLNKSLPPRGTFSVPAWGEAGDGGIVGEVKQAWENFNKRHGIGKT